MAGLWLIIMQIRCRSSIHIQKLCVAVCAKSLPPYVLEYLARSFTDLIIEFVLCVLVHSGRT